MNHYTPPKPKGATHYVCGAWHKIGEHDKVFLYTGSNWTKSEKTKEQLQRAVNKQVLMEL